MTPQKHPNGRKKSRRTWAGLMTALGSNTAKCAYVIAGGALVLLALFLVAITPQRYDLKVGDISHATITASKDVVDEISTSRQREEAARHVEPSYLFKESVASEVLQNLKNVLAQVAAVQQYGAKRLAQYGLENPPQEEVYAFTPAEMQYAHALLTQVTLADYQLNTLLRATDQQMTELADNITSAVSNTLNTTIREGYVNESIQYLRQTIGIKTEMDLLQNVVTPILRKVMQPNMLIDQEATAKLQEEARASVEPVIYKQGQNIVLARERVTANQLEMLRSLGLLDDESIDVVMYVGGALMVLVSLLVLVLPLALFGPGLLQSPKKLSIIMLTLCISLGLCMLGQLLHPYMAPALLGAMMLTGLLGAPAGAAAACSLAVLVSALIAGGDNTYGTEMVNLLVTSLISGLIAVKVILQKPYRQQVLLCGIITACSNLAIIHIIGFMTNNSVQNVFPNALWSAANALIASLLCVGLDPLMESFFNLASPSKLLELSNPNHPLLRRLLLEAPGTYHHSIIVANLAEAAAEAIGANPLLARASAYFHDIGKLKRPLYFKENQLGENPHEHANPYVSAAIVTAHTRDGLVMAQQSRLPQEIQDVIIEHHGGTPVMFFYHKALQQSGGQGVDIADFRYDGKRPHTKESAIIMLADTIEAAVRSMPDPTPEGIEAFIEKLVRGKLEDGQLSEAPITLSDLDKISDAFSTVLNGVFHERIEYPSLEIPQPPAHLPEAVVRTESAVERQELRPKEPEAAVSSAPNGIPQPTAPAAQESQQAQEEAPAPEAQEAVSLPEREADRAKESADVH